MHGPISTARTTEMSSNSQFEVCFCLGDAESESYCHNNIDVTKQPTGSMLLSWSRRVLTL
ncbi:hypothetical protein DPMN_183431 [Dreissena polymorpha]|uniref:Uncharacterized protein n=1 Tax=Dreissena polymorpha TaxID=45954 RepID=A0A9D4DIZ1_DREPO|nr:hypothetical protein DPMN_183431 [Dreissena polymorpha]